MIDFHVGQSVVSTGASHIACRGTIRVIIDDTYLVHWTLHNDPCPHGTISETYKYDYNLTPDEPPCPSIFANWETT